MKPADRVDQWLPLNDVFVRVTKVVGAQDLAFHDIKRSLAGGRIATRERSIADYPNDRAETRALSAKFWQTAELVPFYGQDHIMVEGDGQRAGFACYYFLRQRDVETLWPTDSQITAAGNEALPSWPRRSSAGAKGDYDWEEIIIDAAAFMVANGVPDAAADLYREIEGWFGDNAPSESQLKEHVGPLYRKCK